MYQLYGDGIHDDTDAIQEQIDSGVCEVVLPAPKKHYLISRPLELPSNFRLVLPRYAEIRLADGSNCVMVRNKMVRSFARRLSAEVYESPVQAHLWSYVDDYAPNAPCCNIELRGGVWNFNNRNQLPNPERGMSFQVREFYGCGMLFYNVMGLTLSSLTLKDPSQYGITLDTVSYFRVENIVFDYNLGNPLPVNMDGIHLDGNCHHGTICDLKGTCHDDLVALNAHEGSRGPITDITIRGIYAENCHSAVRLLLVNEDVCNIHISDVYGTYYQYCIGVTKFYPGETTGRYDGLFFDNIYASKALPVRKGDFINPRLPEHEYHLLHIQGGTRVHSLCVEHLHRRERALPKETLHIEKGAVVDRLMLRDITAENATGLPMPLIHNCGHIRYLSLKELDSGMDEMLINDGVIDVLQQ